MHKTLTYFESIFNGTIMIILSVGTWYHLFGLNCQKGKNLQVLLRCLSHVLDPLRFGAWHPQSQESKPSFGLPAMIASQPRTNCSKDISFPMCLARSAFRTSKPHSTFLEIARSSHLSGMSSQIITITLQPNFIIKLYVWMINYYFKPLSFYN